MLGAIAGDVIGSAYEFNSVNDKDFELFTSKSSFTDDSILSVAIAEVLLEKNTFHSNDFAVVIKRYAQSYPNPVGSYGARFDQWAQSDSLEPYNSWGNGSAMRVSAVGFAFDTMAQALEVAKQTAAVTHNHPEGIKGAQATVAAIVLARQNCSKQEIKSFIESTFNYDLHRQLDDIRPTYGFHESCQQTVPESIIAFLESTDFEDAIRNTISLGGDTDTMGAITGAIAEAFYGGIPDFIAHQTLKCLDAPLRKVTLAFCEKYTQSYVY